MTAGGYRHKMAHEQEHILDLTKHPKLLDKIMNHGAGNIEKAYGSPKCGAMMFAVPMIPDAAKVIEPKPLPSFPRLLFGL